MGNIAARIILVLIDLMTSRTILNVYFALARKQTLSDSDHVSFRVKLCGQNCGLGCKCWLRNSVRDKAPVLLESTWVPSRSTPPVPISTQWHTRLQSSSCSRLNLSKSPSVSLQQTCNSTSLLGRARQRSASRGFRLGAPYGASRSTYLCTLLLTFRQPDRLRVAEKAL